MADDILEELLDLVDSAEDVPSARERSRLGGQARSRTCRERRVGLCRRYRVLRAAGLRPEECRLQIMEEENAAGRSISLSYLQHHIK